MNFKASLLYAKKIIFPKKTKSRGNKSLFGAMLCIGISLIPLVAILGVSSGMTEGITNRIIELSSGDLQLYFEKAGPLSSSYENLKTAAEKFYQFDGVNQVFPELTCSALAAGKSYRSGACVRGVEKDIFTKNSGFAEYFEVLDGSTKFENENSAVIGKHLADLLDLKVGDTFRIITINKIGKASVPKVSAFKVSGIVSCGYQELDALWVFIPIQSAFKSLATSSVQFSLEFFTSCTFDSERLFKLQNEIQNFLYFDENFENSYILRWDEVNKSQFENFSSTNALLFLIVFIIVLAASINISSAVVMLVMERKKEIAILKSTGASSFGISFAFLLAGTSCGLGGMIFGIPLGLLICANINQIIKFLESTANFFAGAYNALVYGKDFVSSEIHILNPDFYLQNIPVNIPVEKLVLVGIFTIILSMIMAIIPSVKAGKEKPINTLRKV